MSRIMIVDDDYDILRFCETLLSARGHEVITTTDPGKAFQTLQTHTVDLLVVDVVMPITDGFALLKTIKMNIKHFGAPILMLTGRKSPDDIKRALELGARDYMVKPFDKDVFLKKVESILGMRAPAPEVRFAEGTTAARAQVSFEAIITGVSEMGMTLLTGNYFDRNMKLQVDSSVFADIGIECPSLRVVSCQPISSESEFRYEIFISFIGLDEVAMQRIRKWIAGSAILRRKAS